MTESSNTPTRTNLTAEDIPALQNTVVEALEDVKAKQIEVFDTTDLSSLFERVIIASGNSNRQTRALASSVKDALAEHGYAKPRLEGEENGEWIIVDCGPVVVHIMHPAIRQYYKLEELWGEHPVDLAAKHKQRRADGASDLPDSA